MVVIFYENVFQIICVFNDLFLEGSGSVSFSYYVELSVFPFNTVRFVSRVLELCY